MCFMLQRFLVLLIFSLPLNSFAEKMSEFEASDEYESFFQYVEEVLQDPYKSVIETGKCVKAKKS